MADLENEIDWLVEPDVGYNLPTDAEILPVFLLSKKARAYLAAHQTEFIEFKALSLYKWAMFMSISRKFSDIEINTVSAFGYGPLDQATGLLKYLE